MLTQIGLVVLTLVVLLLVSFFSKLVFHFMLNGAAISWHSKSQPTVALSSAEAEFISASAMVQEVIYFSKFLSNLGFPQTMPTPVFADNETWHRLV